MKHLMNFSQFITEGIRLGTNKKPEIDFTSDNPDDPIKIANPPPAGLTRNRIGNKQSINMYYAYSMDDVPSETKIELMDALKKPDAMSDSELEELIDRTFPNELKREVKSIPMIITTGSSSNLGLRMAEIIRRKYQPNAKIVDLLKKFYADPLDIVNWSAYLKADDDTKEYLDSYLRNHVIGYWDGPAAIAWAKETGNPVRDWPGDQLHKKSTEYTGFIKKSSGLASGARKLINIGHHIDDYIVNMIRLADHEYQRLLADPSIRKTQNVIMVNNPYFLIVDDMMLEGSTLKSINSVIVDKLRSSGLGAYANRIVNYVLVKYKLKETKEKSEEDRVKDTQKRGEKRKETDNLHKVYLQLFKTASTAAKAFNKTVDQYMPQFVRHETEKQKSKPKEQQIEISADKILTAAKKEGLY